MSFDTYTDQQVKDAQYEFSGYQLPLIILDETGPAYVQIQPNPGNFTGIPEWWGWEDPYVVLDLAPNILNGPS